MAKNVKMLAPFAAVTGNISGKQDLKYPIDGGRAYDSPEGLNYAQNYKPRFIACERKSDGKLYFQLRQRSCVNKTTASTKAMAVMGATCSIYAAIRQDLRLMVPMNAIFRALKESGYKGTLRQYFMPLIYDFVAAKSAVIDLSSNQYSAKFNNPFVRGGSEIDITIPNEVLVKFWSVLAIDPVSFTVDGMKGIGSNDSYDETFVTLVDSKHNVLNITLGTVGGDQYPMIGTQYLITQSGNYPDAGDNVENGVFTLTSVAPQA